MPRRPDEERQSAAELVTLLLRERGLRIEKQAYTEANDRQVTEIVSLLLWKHSEACGKYNGCQHWSDGALLSLKRHGKIVTSNPKFGGDALRHEHLFPRNQMIKKLFSLTDPSVSEVRALLDRLNIGVVVTMDEDKRLPSVGDETDPWNRYRQVGIRWTESK